MSGISSIFGVHKCSSSRFVSPRATEFGSKFGSNTNGVFSMGSPVGDQTVTAGTPRAMCSRMQYASRFHVSFFSHPFGAARTVPVRISRAYSLFRKVRRLHESRFHAAGRMTAKGREPPPEPGTKRMICTTLMSAFASSRQVNSWLSFKHLVAGSVGQGREHDRHDDG